MGRSGSVQLDHPNRSVITRSNVARNERLFPLLVGELMMADELERGSMPKKWGGVRQLTNTKHMAQPLSFPLSHPPGAFSLVVHDLSTRPEY
jgi:hypothetical protein